MTHEPVQRGIPPDPWDDLRAHTQARLALGRAGAALPTAELLRFGLAHAQARDAVHIPLAAEALATQLQAQGCATLPVHSAAPDRATYLLRPDLGRRLSDADAQALRESSANGTTPIDLLLVVADRRAAGPQLARQPGHLPHLAPAGGAPRCAAQLHLQRAARGTAPRRCRCAPVVAVPGGAATGADGGGAEGQQ